MLLCTVRAVHSQCPVFCWYPSLSRVQCSYDTWIAKCRPKDEHEYSCFLYAAAVLLLVVYSTACFCSFSSCVTTYLPAKIHSSCTSSRMLPSDNVSRPVQLYMNWYSIPPRSWQIYRVLGVPPVYWILAICSTHCLATPKYLWMPQYSQYQEPDKTSVLPVSNLSRKIWSTFRRSTSLFLFLLCH